MRSKKLLLPTLNLPLCINKHNVCGNQYNLIPPEHIPRINLLRHIIQTAIIPVGNNRMAHRLKLLQIIYHPTAKESGPILQSRLIYNHSCNKILPGSITLHDCLYEILRHIARLHWYKLLIRFENYHLMIPNVNLLLT